MKVWRDRLAGCRADAEVHASILAVRSLVLGPTDDFEAVLTLSDLSRQAERFKLAERVLLDPLSALKADLNGPVFGFMVGDFVMQDDGVLSVDDAVVGQGVMEGRQPSSAGPNIQQLSSRLVSLAGGLER